MIDGMDWSEAYLRDLRLRPATQIIISATGHEARTPRSVEAHGEVERDEDGHPVGTRVSLRLTGAVLNATSSSGVLMNGTSSSDLIRTITVYMPTTETGPYVSDQIVDGIKYTAVTGRVPRRQAIAPNAASERITDKLWRGILPADEPVN